MRVFGELWNPVLRHCKSLAASHRIPNRSRLSLTRTAPMLRLARLACLVGAFAFAGSTFAQNITEATPTSAAVGTTLTITGTGFGTAKPKVQLFDTATSKKYALKVVDNSDTVIHATITKAVEGDLQLQVIVK